MMKKSLMNNVKIMDRRAFSAFDFVRRLVQKIYLQIDTYKTRKAYIVHIDGIAHDRLSGWAIQHGSATPVRLFLLVNGLPHSLTKACIFRQDLLDAGISAGFSGFSFQLTQGADLPKSMQVCLLTPFNQLVQLAEWVPVTITKLANNDTHKSLRHRSLANMVDREISFDHLLAKTVLETNKTTQMTAYFNYIFTLQSDFGGRRNACTLQQFFDGLGEQRGELMQLPLTKGQITYLNTTVTLPNGQVSERILSWYKDELLSADVDMVHCNRTLALEIYWWCFDKAPSLGVEDCTILPRHIKILQDMPMDMSHQGWPLTYGMEVACARYNLLGEGERKCSKQRRKVYHALIELSHGSRELLLLMPLYWLKLIIMPCDGLGDEYGSRSALYLQIQKMGFSLKTGAFENKWEETGLRLKVPKTGTSPLIDKCVNFQLVGCFDRMSGLSQASRASALIFNRLSIQTSIYNFSLENPQPIQNGINEWPDKLNSASINLLHYNADQIPKVMLCLPDVFSASYNIGYFFWELDKPAESHLLALDLLDEIWVSSDYGVEIYQPYTDKPVINVGMCLENIPEISRQAGRKELNKHLLSPEPFVFFFSFDAFSYSERKNPLGTIRAFQLAFNAGEKACFVIKCHNMSDVMNSPQKDKLMTLLTQIDNDERLLLIDEAVEYETMLKLVKGADCYVSLHRSEGFGYGMAEAMQLNVPVIATGYSGNLAFCNEDTAFLVDFELKDVEPGDYVYYQKGQKWAEPDLDHAASMMKKIFDNPELARKKADAAWRLVNKELSTTVISKCYEGRVKEILNFG